MSERLAGEIRSALGQMNDDAEPVVLLVRDLVEQLAELREGIANAMLCDTAVQMHECLTVLLQEEQ